MIVVESGMSDSEAVKFGLLPSEYTMMGVTQYFCPENDVKLLCCVLGMTLNSFLLFSSTPRINGRRER